MRFKAAVLAVALATLAARAQQPGRVILISLDGMGYDAFKHDAAAGGMTALREIAAEGVEAKGMTPHYPSTTANSHAALFTGAWGDVNGITGNTMPVAPRNEHTAFERIIGYRSDGLRAEPVWVTAARQGVRAVAQQVTQAYPFTPRSTGEGLSTPPVVINGYQTKLVAGHRALRRRDLTEEPCSSGPVIERILKPVCFTWSAGPVPLHAIMLPDGRRYRLLRISTKPGGPYVEAWQAPAEDSPVGERELARYFSGGLYIDKVSGSTPAVVYFRLFELKEDGSDFLLYESPIHEFGMHDGSGETAKTTETFLREAGGFIGNGPAHDLNAEPFIFGTPAWKGGDGAAERRYLEVMELVVRQSLRHTQWLWNHYAPRLLVTYLPYPDEMEHLWKGLSERDSRYTDFRKLGYSIVNRAVQVLVALRTPADHLLVTSDHGMAVVSKQVRINEALRRAGLLGAAPDGKPDPGTTRVMHLHNCLLINSNDWKGGLVPPGERSEVLTKAENALRGIRDVETGAAVVTRIYDTPADAERFGYGGPAGEDACFDYLPGYAGVDMARSPEVAPFSYPIGYHGLDPTRPEMEAILIGIGPRLPTGQTWPRQRSIDVIPLVFDLLGLRPPPTARGQSPLGAE
jgi:hypothetical protein